MAEAVHRDRLFNLSRLGVALQFLADPGHAEHAAEAVQEKWKVRRWKVRSPLLARWTTAQFFPESLFERWNSASEAIKGKLGIIPRAGRTARPS